MRKLWATLAAAFLVTSCTINLQIDTDFAAQKESGGVINEEVTTSATSETDPAVDVSANVEGETL